MTFLNVLAPAILSMSSAADAPASATMNAVPMIPAPTAIAPEPLYEHGKMEGGGLYLRLNGGLVTTRSSDGPSEDIDFDEGYLIAVAIGQRLSSGDNPVNFGLELEGVWTDQDANTDGPLDAVRDVTTIGGFLNGVFDFRVADRFSIYAGAGIGAAWMDVGTTSDSLNDFSSDDGPLLAWQAKAGLMWRTSANTALTVGYRFMNIDDNKIEDGIGSSSFDLQTEQHTIEIGVQFGF